MSELLARDDRGWLVIEQDRILAPGEPEKDAMDGQDRNVQRLNREPTRTVRQSAAPGDRPAAALTAGGAQTR